MSRQRPRNPRARATRSARRQASEPESAPTRIEINFSPRQLAVTLAANALVTFLVVMVMLQWWPDGSSNKAPASPTPAALSSEISNHLDQLSDAWSKVNARVTYDITDATGEGQTKTSLTLYLNRPLARADIVDDTGKKTTLISKSDKSYSCSVPESGPQCLASDPSDPETAIPFLSQFDPGSVKSALIQGLSVTSIASSTEQIRGSDAYCITAIGLSGGQDLTIKWCFAPNGIMVYELGSDASGQSTLEAIDIGQTVAADFEPPYPIVTPTPTPTASPTP